MPFTWSSVEAAIFKTEWQEEASAFCQQIGIQAAPVTTIFVALEVLHRMAKCFPIRNMKREQLEVGSEVWTIGWVGRLFKRVNFYSMLVYVPFPTQRHALSYHEGISRSSSR